MIPRFVVEEFDVAVRIVFCPLVVTIDETFNEILLEPEVLEQEASHLLRLFLHFGSHFVVVKNGVMIDGRKKERAGPSRDAMVDGSGSLTQDNVVGLRTNLELVNLFILMIHPV